MYHHVLQMSDILFTFLPFRRHSSTAQEYSDNFQPCWNGTETGNNGIADNTARSVIHLIHWLSYAVFSFNS